MFKKIIAHFWKLDAAPQIGRWRNVRKGCVNTCPSDPGYYNTQTEQTNATVHKNKDVPSYDEIMEMTWNDPGV